MMTYLHHVLQLLLIYFSRILNFFETAVINAFILLKEKKLDINRRHQLLFLATLLTDPYIKMKKNQMKLEKQSETTSLML